jgi:gamma-tubulin complex component 5
LAILDLSLQFASALVAYIAESTDGDKTFSFEATSKEKKRRRRHQKRTRHRERNTIGFIEHTAPSGVESSSSSSEGEINEGDLERDEAILAGMVSERMNRPSLASSISFAEESFTVKVDRVSDELDGLVRYVRKAVDVLAGGSNETSATFGVLSFMLEEWDM